MMKLNKNIAFLIFGLLFIHLPTQHLFGQTKILDYQEKNTYEIGGVEIVGAVNRDRSAIKSITGLREGTKVQIPGPTIPQAIKALLKLKLFEDVQIFQEKIENNTVFLKIVLIERPILSKYSYKGAKTSQHEDLNEVVKNIITKGGIVTEDQKELARLKIREFYVNKGKLDTEVKINEYPETGLSTSAIRMEFVINQKSKVKIKDVIVDGNKAFSDRKIRKKLDKTKRKGTLFKKSKFIRKDYENDLKEVVKYYQKNGYKNMSYKLDTTYRNAKGQVVVKLDIDEGNKHYIRNIKWKGNSLYTEEYLAAILGVTRGDVYNPELLQNRLKFSLDGRDISSLYLDDGYLSFEVIPVEVAIEKDSVDIEMRIFEGPQFTVENVIIKGNDRTNEHVIRREIRTRPGEKFSRSAIIRSQREITNLGFFNPETIDIQPQVNNARGTVDIVYSLEEKPVDQLELSAGYGGVQGLIGTLGVVFNNFSIANVRDRNTWSPLPQGDGQKLSVRLQSNSRFFKSYNLSFTEPWLGGSKPRSFTIGGVQTAFDYSINGGGKLKITRGFIGLGSQLKWPDDYFSSNTTLNIEQIDLDNFSSGGFAITKGKFNNFSLKQTFTRSSVSDPLYPRRGSRISLAIQATVPYSLFRDKETAYTPTETEIAEIKQELIDLGGPANPPTATTIQNKVDELIESKKFGWLEYHKWKFGAEWYFNIWNKLVAATNVKIGILGAYDKDLGISPFERFEVGGDGVNNQNTGLQGKEIISLRGYTPEDLSGNGNTTNGGSFEGAPIYNKFTFELRYPLSLNPSSTIFVTSFVQGGNAYKSFSDYNPFDLKRSAGFGARVFLPMFGLLGFDYGWGFDKFNPEGGKFGKFNIVLGFEPE
jgi:outer membrane protein insertion porin family